uniref:GRIP domain-containing protein n=1 Tax=Panagrolaimus sp. JU765 TaxID=591449 RepID=A0AC34QJS5_9BILA
MFKGLKSKLEDEAKRLSATASQYATNVANQVRSGASDAGSDISGYTKKFLNNTTTTEPSVKNSVSTMREENLITLDDDVGDSEPNSSALLTAFDDPPERVRRLSDASIDSNDSSLSALYGSVLNQSSAPKLETISSDVESVSDGGWEPPETATKDQLKSVLDNIRGRAINYKEKYHDLVKKYNESIRENEKLKLVLTKTQDKTLKRIDKLREENKKLNELLNNDEKEQKVKKLQELLERCRETITTQKSKIAALITENQQMKEKVESSGEVEKINAEWKGRIDRINEEHSKRLNDVEEKSAIAIASAKAESHSMMQQKDQEIEKWINKCHKLEKESDAGKKYEQQLNQLHKTIAALETEKADMVDKLSKAKQEGVKLVLEEETKKQEALKTEFEERIRSLESEIEDLKKSSEHNNQLEENVKVQELAAKIGEYEIQSEEAKNFSIQSTEEIANLKEQVSNLESEKESAEKKIVDLKEQLTKLSQSFEDEKAKILEKQSIDNLKDQLRNLEQETETLQNELKNKDEDLDHLKDTITTLQFEKNVVEKKNEELVNEMDEMKAHYTTLNDLHRESDAKTSNVMQQIDELLGKITTLESAIVQKEKEMEDVQEKLKMERELAAQVKLEFEEKLKNEKQNDEPKVDFNIREHSHKLAEYFETLHIGFGADSINDVSELVEKTLQSFSAYVKQLDEKLEADLNSAKKNHQQLDEKIKEEMNNLVEELEQIKNENAQLKDELDITNNENEQNLKLMENMQEALKTAKEHAEEVICEKVNATDMIEKIEEKLTAFEMEGTVFDKVCKLIKDFEEKSNDGNSLEEIKQKELEMGQELVELKSKIDSMMKEREEYHSQLHSVLNLQENGDAFEKIAELVESAEKLEEIEAAYQSANKINAQITNQNETLMTSFEEIATIVNYDGKQGNVMEQVRNVMHELNDKRAKVEKLSSDYATLKEQLDYVNEELKMYKSETNDLQKKFNDINEEIVNKDLKINQLEAADQKLMELLSMLDSFNERGDIYSLVDNIAKLLNERNSNTCGLTEKIAKKLSAENENHAALIQNAKDLETTLKKYETEKVEAEKQLLDLQKSHEDLRIQFIQKEKFVEEMHVKLGNLEKELKNEREGSNLVAEEFSRKQSEYDETVLLQTNKIKEIIAENESLKKEKYAVEAKMTNQLEEHNELTKKIHKYEDQLKVLNNQEKEVNEVIKEKDTIIAGLKEQISEAQDTLKELMDEKRKDDLATENNNRKLKTLERELRDVCETLDKKNVEINLSNQKIKELEEQLHEANERDRNGNGFVDDSGFDALLDQEELASLRVQVEELKSENKKLEEQVDDLTKKKTNQMNDSLEAALEMRSVVQPTKLPPPQNDHHFNSETARFAEPTEAEYLRNVLYRYMVERETLGREIVTLAKVICQVLKFSPSESTTVLQREEARTHGWIGDTVGSVFQR